MSGHSDLLLRVLKHLDQRLSRRELQGLWVTPRSVTVSSYSEMHAPFKFSIRTVGKVDGPYGPYGASHCVLSVMVRCMLR